MTTTQTFDRAVGEYVGQCMEHVRDLPPELQADIVDDLRQVVAEVSAELDGNPADLLGPPARFVDELRAAAGLRREVLEGEPSPPHPNVDWAEIGRKALAAVRAALVAGRRMVHDLRPAGWLVRGYAIAAFIAYGVSDGAHAWWLFDVFPIPRLGNSALGGVLLTIVSMALSVAVGRRPQIGWRRLAIGALSLASAVALVTTTQQLRDHSQFDAVLHADVPAVTMAFPEEVATGTAPIARAALTAGAGDIVVEIDSVEQAVASYESLRAAGYDVITLNSEVGSWQIDSPDMLYDILLGVLGLE